MQDVGKYKEIYGIEEGEGIYIFFYKSPTNTCSSSQHVRVNNENIFYQTSMSTTIDIPAQYPAVAFPNLKFWSFYLFIYKFKLYWYEEYKDCNYTIFFFFRNKNH